MSLNEEDRRTIVQLEIQKAEQTFAEKDVLISGELWNTLANRLYYSLFHAVSALLINDHHEVGTHKGAVIRFHQYTDGALYQRGRLFLFSTANSTRKGRLQLLFQCVKRRCTISHRARKSAYQ